MNEEQVIQERLNHLIESVNVLTDNVHSALSYTDERLKAIEKLMWKIERKLIDQDKFIENLSSNTLIDQMVKSKIITDQIKPFHLQSETYRRQTAEAIMDEDD